MRKLSFALVAVFCMAVAAQAQTVTAVPYAKNVKTESALNMPKEIAPSVTTTTTAITAAYLVGIEINTSAASDSIRVFDGSTQIATIALGATASGVPVFVPYNCEIASDSLNVYKKGASDITVIYRTAY